MWRETMWWAAVRVLHLAVPPPAIFAPSTWRERVPRSGSGSCPVIERYVAVKFVHPTKDAAARARVLEEARAIARLQHPNVVAIHRVADFAGHPYLVSEYVHGVALNQLERPMPWRQALDIAIDLT